MFEGRSPRTHVWMLYGATFMGAFFIALLPELFNDDLFSILFSILFVMFFFGANIAYLIIGIRRLHDMDKSGWWMLFVFVPLANLALMVALLFTPGTKGDNNYGPDPRDSTVSEGDA